MRLFSTTAIVGAVGLAALGGAAAEGQFGPWSAAVNIESIPGTDPAFNTEFLDGSLGRDGYTFYLPSNRPGAERARLMLRHNAGNEQRQRLTYRRGYGFVAYPGITT